MRYGYNHRFQTQLLLIIIALLPAIGFGQGNLLRNGDFEEANYGPTFYVDSNSNYQPLLPGWTILPLGDIGLIPPGYLGAPSQEVDISGSNPTLAGSGIYQNFTATPGVACTISFDYYTYYPAAPGALSFLVNNNVVFYGLNTNGNDARATYTYTFTPTSSANQVRFENIIGAVVHIDNVLATQPVPEPGTLAVLGFGAFGLIRRRAFAKK